MDGKKNPSDAGTKPLDQEALQICMRNLGIVSRKIAGFGTDEAYQVLAALLLLFTGVRGAEGASHLESNAGAQDACLAGGVETKFMMVVLTFVGVVTGVLIERHVLKERSEERSVRTARQVDVGVQVEPTPKRCEEKGSQGPGTYARHRAQPRFVPLPEVSWG